MYGLMDKVKDLITAPSLDTEKKFADRISVDNYINVMRTTNNTNPVSVKCCKYTNRTNKINADSAKC